MNLVLICPRHLAQQRRVSPKRLRWAGQLRRLIEACACRSAGPKQTQRDYSKGLEKAAGRALFPLLLTTAGKKWPLRLARKGGAKPAWPRAFGPVLKSSSEDRRRRKSAA